MALERLDYYWGMYPSVEEADPNEAEEQMHLGPEKMPPAVVDAFREEKISELSGEYGMRGVGSPVQVERVRYTHEGTDHKIVVVNRIIVLFKTNDPTMRRLHRFIERMKREAKSTDADRGD